MRIAETTEFFVDHRAGDKVHDLGREVHVGGDFTGDDVAPNDCQALAVIGTVKRDADDLAGRHVAILVANLTLEVGDGNRLFLDVQFDTVVDEKLLGHMRKHR